MESEGFLVEVKGSLGHRRGSESIRGIPVNINAFVILYHGFGHSIMGSDRTHWFSWRIKKSFEERVARVSRFLQYKRDSTKVSSRVKKKMKMEMKRIVHLFKGLINK